MKLSVIIPCYNAAATLAVQLEALAEQKCSDAWEVIVADNGSTDHSVSIAQSFQTRFPVLRIVEAGERRGAAYARNRGADQARGEFLLFCDADDQVAPGYLRAMSEALSQHEFVACRYDFDKLNRRWVSRFPGSQTEDLDRGMLGPYAYAGGGSLGIRKRVHQSIGGFDESFGALEDTDYCVRLQRAGISLHFAPDALIHVRRRNTMAQSFNQARRWGRAFIAVRVRHWPIKEAPETPHSLVRYLLTLRRIRTTEQLAVWIWSIGWRFGSFQGWREHLRNRRGGLSHMDGSSRSAAQRVSSNSDPMPRLSLMERVKRPIRALAGKLVLGAIPLRDCAYNEMLRREFGSIDPTSHLDYPLKIDGAENIHIGEGARISSGTWLFAVTSYGDQVFKPKIQIGANAQIGRYCHIVATKKIVIGKQVTLRDRVYLSDNLHDYRDVLRPIAKNELLSCGEVHIGDGSRIEENVCIVGNVKIGEHCIVSANAVVTRSLPPFSVAAGIPARIIKRYNPSSRQWEATASDDSFKSEGEAPEDKLSGKFSTFDPPSPPIPFR